MFPVDASADLTTRYTVGVGATLVATISRNWDLDVSGAVQDLGTNRLPYFSFGFAKRWGG